MDYDPTGAGEAARTLDTTEAITMALHYTRMLTDTDAIDGAVDPGDPLSNAELISVAQVYALIALARAVERLSSRPSATP